MKLTGQISRHPNDANREVGPIKIANGNNNKRSAFSMSDSCSIDSEDPLTGTRA